MLILKLLSRICLHLTRGCKIILPRIKCFNHPSDTTVSIVKASNLNLSAVPRYWRVKIHLHTTLHSALDRDEWSVSLLGRFIWRERERERERERDTAVPIRKSGGQNTLDTVANSFCLFRSSNRGHPVSNLAHSLSYPNSIPNVG